MFHCISNKLAKSIVNLSNEEFDIEVIEFAIESFLNATITIIVLIVTAILFHQEWNMFIIAISFAILRMLTGGAHIETNWGCTILTTLLVLGLSYVKLPITASYILTSLSLLILHIYSYYCIEKYTSERVLKNQDFFKKLSFIWISLGFITPFFDSLKCLATGIFVQMVSITPFGVYSIDYLNQKILKRSDHT